MSTTHQSSCDHCKRVMPRLTDSTVHERAGWMTLTLGGRGYAVEDVHICDRCIKALADFLPGVEREKIGAFATHETSIRLASKAPIKPSQTVPVITRAETTFGPMAFAIDNPTNWVVFGLKVGNRSQILGDSRDKPIAGAVFNEMSPEFHLDVVPPDCDLVIMVQYVGENPEGAAFSCKVTGLMAGFGPEPGRA